MIITIFGVIEKNKWLRMGEQKVEKRLQPLTDIWELASSESVDAYTLAYTNLLQNHPDCQVS